MAMLNNQRVTKPPYELGIHAPPHIHGQLELPSELFNHMIVYNLSLTPQDQGQTVDMLDMSEY